MDSSQLDKFRQILTARSQALGEEVHTLDTSRSEALTTAREEPEDSGDEAEIRRDDEVRNAEEDRDDNELRQVTAALLRIDAGTYGVCEECGIDIPLARLEVQPAAALCIQCQEQLEQRLARAA